MKWKLEEIKDMTAMKYYEIAKHHRLVPDDPDQAVARYQHLENTAIAMRLLEGDEELAIFIVCDISKGSSATLEMIPHPQHFRGGYDEKLIGAMEPLWGQVFDVLGTRRLTAFIPESRGRTKKALKVCGFRHEGWIRQMVKFEKKNPEDIFVLGLLNGEQAIPETGETKDMDGEC